MIEKSILTPDLYPLTLNSLVSACNQKSARNPVMKLQSGEVQHTIRLLEAKHFVRTEENFKSRAEKYLQRFCNTRYSDYQFEPPQLAIVCLLLLRGPQTPGEVRARSGRLFAFDDNEAVVVALNSLMETASEPLVLQLPRTAGRKDSEYMHLFSGPVDIEAHVSQAESARPADRVNMTDLAHRVSELEEEVARLKELVK